MTLNPKLAVGEAYMDGGLVALGGSIHDVLEIVFANLRTDRKEPLVPARGCSRRASEDDAAA